MDYREDEEKFKDLLNQEYAWPAKYLFKFIVKEAGAAEVINLFDDSVDISQKPSTGGKYISFSIRSTMANAEEIMKVYNKASKIAGIISL